MTGKGLKALAGGLHHTPELLMLYLSSNSRITDNETWRKLAAELCLIEKKYPCKACTVLDLSGCTITKPVLAELKTPIRTAAV